MKYSSILFAAFVLTAFFASSGIAQETVARINQPALTKDSVWSGKIIVEKPLSVPKGVTLTIRPGTVVGFKKDAGLVVGGVLKAAGKKGLPVSFTSDEKEPSPGDWTGINFMESGDGTALKHCSVSYAGAVTVSVCSPAIQDCEITKGSQGIVLARKARPSISGSSIREMSGGGISCQMGSYPLITGNVIDRCGPYGISSSQDSQPTMKGNTISGCETGVSLAQSVPPIESNVFKGNKTGLFLSSAGNTILIRNNKFLDNETGLVCQQFSNPLIEKNIISGNKQGLVCFRAASPIIRNNEIYKNGEAVNCIQLCSPKITANNIYGNKRGIYLDLSSYAVINGNNIYSNEIEVELGNMSSDWERRVNNKPARGSQAQNLTMASRGRAMAQRMEDGAHIMGEVDATGNWWGDVTDEMEAKGPKANIKSFIDYYDVPTRTYEGYSGIYTQDRINYEGWKKLRIKNAGI